MIIWLLSGRVVSLYASLKQARLKPHIPDLIGAVTVLVNAFVAIFAPLYRD